jgi:hypothetical protein
MREVV